jgi:hypothetical protein
MQVTQEHRCPFERDGETGVTLETGTSTLDGMQLADLDHHFILEELELSPILQCINKPVMPLQSSKRHTPKSPITCEYEFHLHKCCAVCMIYLIITLQQARSV